MIGEEPRPPPPRRSGQRTSVPTTEIEQWVTQLRDEFNVRGLDWDVLTQRFTRFLEEQQRREESSRSVLEQRLAQFRHEYAEAMNETAMSFVCIHQEFQGWGSRFEQLCQLAHTLLMPRMDEFQTELDRTGVRVAQVTRKHEQFSNDIGNTAALIKDVQDDLKEVFRNLERDVEQHIGTSHGGTTPGDAPPDNAIAMNVDVDDLKTKVARLIEQMDRHNREVAHFNPIMHRMDLAEGQLERWTSYLPGPGSVDQLKIFRAM